MKQKIIKWILFCLLCLVIIASISLNIYQHQELKRLSLSAARLSAKESIAADGTPKPMQATPTPAPFVDKPADAQKDSAADNIDALKNELASIEDELDKANKKLSDKKLKEAEKKEKEKAARKAAMYSSLVYQYGVLFDDLNLSPDKLEKLKNLLVDENFAMSETYSNLIMPSAATQEERSKIKQLTDKIKDEYDAKYKELLGSDDYKIYSAYKDRSSSRIQVTFFNQTLDTDQSLTKEQQKALIEIMYDDEERATNEIVRNQPKEPPPEQAKKSFADRLKETETTYAKIIDDAKSTLSSSQLEALKAYLKNQRDMMEASYKMQTTMENSDQYK